MRSEPQDDRDERILDEDEELLREIRKQYRHFLDYWRENREEAAIDSRFAAGDPWDAAARKERESLRKPILTPDELSQYVKQANNNLRQNKRAIKVEAKGSGATDDDAQWRAAYIRAIEYKSNAQAAYTTAFEQAVWCGFLGAIRITITPPDKNGKMEPRIRRIPNAAATVLPDPYAKEADFSDMKRCFVLDIMRTEDFAEKYPDAKKKSFSGEDGKIAPDWIKGESLVVAEYWRVKDGKVLQYLTNGFEILETTEWIGSRIPIPIMVGEEVYQNDMTGQSKRMYLSLIRRARAAQQMICYIASAEAEEFGMAPRAPMVGIKGQFESSRKDWATLNVEPKAFIEYDVPTQWNPAWGAPPPPTRPQFQPNPQAYEVAFERWRRSTQAAVGIMPLPTGAQRQNEKSGVALERIQTQEQIGSFHFTDNYDRFLENAGSQVNELITRLGEAGVLPDEIGIRKPDEKHDVLAMQELDPTRGDFDVTIGTGPSFQSQREEAASFVDVLIRNIQALPIPDQLKAKLLSLAVKLKNIGPLGDEISKILDPSGNGDPIPPQAQAAMAQAQQQLKALNAYAQQLEGEVKKLTFEQKAKIVEHQGKMDEIRLQIEGKITESEITTKSQVIMERLTFIQDMIKQLHMNTHDRMMQADSQQAQAAQAQQAQDAAMEQQAMAQQAPAAAAAQTSQ